MSTSARVYALEGGGVSCLSPWSSSSSSSGSTEQVCIVYVLLLTTMCIQLLALDSRARVKIVKEADLDVKGDDVDSEMVEMAREVVGLLR